MWQSIGETRHLWNILDWTYHLFTVFANVSGFPACSSREHWPVYKVSCAHVHSFIFPFGSYRSNEFITRLPVPFDEYFSCPPTLVLSNSRTRCYTWKMNLSDTWQLIVKRSRNGETDTWMLRRGKRWSTKKYIHKSKRLTRSEIDRNYFSRIYKRIVTGIYLISVTLGNRL